MTDEIKDNLGNPDNWLRAVLIVVFGLIFYVAVWVLGLVVLLNLVVLLVTGRRNDNLSEFGAQTGDYLMQIIRFATLNSEVRPFPFG
ncbi:MAG: DUF4389 domain-containing protein, partial [Xanthomonadales bacterium]|nr:DUF4389 domain-containing protein [Xanthomonadales bacterium]